MNQRQLDPAIPVLPRSSGSEQQKTPAAEARAAPEEVMFDKAELAARLTRLQEQRDETEQQLKALEQDHAATDKASEIAWRKRQLENLDELIATFHHP